MSISSRFLSLQPSYYLDLNEGHDPIFDHQHQMTPFSFSSLQSSASSLSSSSSSSSPLYFHQASDQPGFCFFSSQIQAYPYQQEVENLSSFERGSCDQASLEISKKENNGLKFSICKKEDHKSLDAKWMSSKMRVMKKMMKTEVDKKSEADTSIVNNNENTAIRVCSDCSTTKTPLWRSGPRGPKSLCNACGIRQRKARRAMAAAAAATTNGSILPRNLSNATIRTGNIHKKTTTTNNNNGIGVHKKRSKMCKLARNQQQAEIRRENLSSTIGLNNTHRKICFEKFALNLTKKLSLQEVFPQEEKEAAILLMALSCGLVRG